jgi:drug/metabolite transporter (DMT)-like permease
LGKGELWALLAALAYALNNVFVRIAVRDYDPNRWMGVALRATPTFLFALVMGWRMQRRDPEDVSPLSQGRLTLMLCGYGLATFVIANPLLFRALRVGGVLIATPVTGTQALWAGLIAMIVLKDPLNARMVGGMAVTIGGITLLAVGQSLGTPVSPDWWQAVPLALGTAFCWSLSGVLVTGAMRRGVDRFSALAMATGSGIIALNVYLLLSGQLSAYTTTPPIALLSLLAAGALNAVALVSVTTALSLTTVASATTLNSLQIGLAPLIAWLFLGEPLNLLMGVAIPIIILGVILVQRARPMKR